MSKTRILIVDDEPKNLKILRISLGNEYDIREAHSGEEAVDALKTFEPAVIILDIMMPKLDGFAVTRQVKSTPALSATKIILVSGKAMIEDKLEGYRCGADDYITKPFNGEELKAKLGTFVKLYDLETQLRELNASLEEQVRIRSEQLMASERLAFVGRHACDIVHNLRNPLTIAKMHLARLEPIIGQHDSYLKINKAMDRFVTIMKDVMSANAGINEGGQLADVNAVVQDELELLKLDTFVKFNVSHDVLLNARSKVALAPVHLHQVVGNLVKNAFEAMHGMREGRVQVTTRELDHGVELTITDNGCGISKENMEKIFEPLFTTKLGANNGPVGNGLGLPYCKKIIESYGGKISVAANPEGGTIVTLILPLEPGGPAHSPARGGASAAAS